MDYSLKYRPDAGKVIDRFEAWWHCEIIDRPLVSLNVPPEKPYDLPSKEHGTAKDSWFDTDHQIESVEAYFSQKRWIGDSLPIFMPNLGPEVMATIFGAELEFSPDTSWSYPVVSSCAEILSLEPSFDNPYWQKIRELTERSLEVGNGKWITAYTDLHTNGDLLAALRDPQELCLDMADDIESVKAACEYVTTIFADAYDDLWNRIERYRQPSVTWLSAPHWGKMFVPNCDASALLSRPMFEHTIWPSILEEVSHCDRSIYHLDGPTSLQHLDLILDEPKIQGLQWVWGEGNGPAAKWVEVYRKAQAKGKCLQVICVDLNDARELMRYLKPEGVWFTIGQSCGVEEAESFLKELAAWA
jgi:hypothetical protein